MDIILNQIAIWRPCGAAELNMRKSPSGQQYREPNGVVYKNSVKPLSRYAKDYEVEKVGFSLFVRTDCDDAQKVEQALDYYATQITKEYALQATNATDLVHFEYTPYVFNAAQVITKESAK